MPCPHCAGEIAPNATHCPHCARRCVNFILCDACREPIAADAKRCPYCAQRIRTAAELAAQELAMEIRATPFGGLIFSGITSLFMPPIIRVGEGRIEVLRWSFFGLRRDHQEIQVDRVASVRYTKGIIWGGLLIETFGGASEDITERGLRQHEAHELAEQLKSIVAQRD
ncbi:MAG: hypothetical protein GC159_03015 [Phycisphaera sp.]|nr:hypothetical protein [Phycisphaera sp.]